MGHAEWVRRSLDAGEIFGKGQVCTQVVAGVELAAEHSFSDPEEALVKATAMRQAYISYVLADSSKFGRVSAATVAPLDRACIITDALPDKSYAKHAIIKEAEPL